MTDEKAPEKKKELDDLTVMNRIKRLMEALPELDRARVAQWVAQRWAK